MLIQNGAARVYAVDVGQGQLAWKLRQDPRVVVLEKTNARHLTAEQIPDPIDLVVCDASFIGLEVVLPAALALTRPQGLAGRADQAAIRGRQGPRRQGRRGARAGAAQGSLRPYRSLGGNALPGWTVRGIVESPIKGPEGNIEFLIAAEKGE